MFKFAYFLKVIDIRHLAKSENIIFFYLGYIVTPFLVCLGHGYACFSVLGMVRHNDVTLSAAALGPQGVRARQVNI